MYNSLLPSTCHPYVKKKTVSVMANRKNMYGKYLPPISCPGPPICQMSRHKDLANIWHGEVIINYKSPGGGLAKQHFVILQGCMIKNSARVHDSFLFLGFSLQRRWGIYQRNKALRSLNRVCFAARKCCIIFLLVKAMLLPWTLRVQKRRMCSIKSSCT